ncbi:MAG TPA: hypothetical protein VND93_23995 [Myxococcales bacterium]|nr:hypothetical protein [Myxococcales bacterium]
MIPPLAVLVAALAIGANPAGSVVKLAAPGLTLVDVDRARGTFFLEYFCEQLSHQGPIRITTEAEVAALVGFEREKELLGCSDAAKQSCFVELADALGVDGLIVGNVAKVGSGYAATIKVVSSRDGDPYGSRSTRVKTEDELLDWFQAVARELAPGVLQHRHPGAAPSAGPGGPGGPQPPGPGPASPPAAEPAPFRPGGTGGSGGLNTLRLSAPIFRVEYGRRLWPHVLVGARASANVAAAEVGIPPSDFVISLGGGLSAMGRYELGPRDGLHAELVATVGGGYGRVYDSDGLAFAATAGGAVAYGGFRAGLEVLLVAPLLDTSSVPFHIGLLPEVGWAFEF